MAVSPGDARLSVLRLDPLLVSYLLERDDRPPTGHLTLETGVATSVGILRRHTLKWAYTPDVTPRGLSADGFVIYWETGAVKTPTDVAILVPGEQRQWQQFVPPSTQITYGLAAFRLTHKGLAVGPKLIDAAWVLT